MDEFDIIERFFSARALDNEMVVAGIGDDAAVLSVPAGHDLVVAMDTMVQGVHFRGDVNPVSVGYKLAAVNLSDLAAMGADPAWSLLSLTLPEVDEEWLNGFSSGLHDLLGKYGVALVGGDTTRGPLSLCLQIAGLVPEGKSILRSGALPGDVVCISGMIGGSALALASIDGRVLPEPEDLQCLIAGLNRPVPRVRLGAALRGLAGSCIDISDGLAADLGHLAAASEVGMEITLGDIPVPRGCQEFLRAGGDWGMLLSGGDDYELAFTVRPADLGDVFSRIEGLDLTVTRIGNVTEGHGVSFLEADGGRAELVLSGYNHFKGNEQE